MIIIINAMRALTTCVHCYACADKRASLAPPPLSPAVPPSLIA